MLDEAVLCARGGDQQMKAGTICCYCTSKRMTKAVMQNCFMHAWVHL